MDTASSSGRPLRIAFWGSGNLARSLGAAWVRAGHSVAVSSRSRTSAADLATTLGHGSTAGSVGDIAQGADVIVMAAPFAAVDAILDELIGPDPAFSSSPVPDGVTLIDPTNPVVHGVGTHELAAGSAAERIAERLPTAHVVKAFNVYPAPTWSDVPGLVVVPIAGDDARALAVATRLIGEVGVRAHVLGPLTRARQIEELAGAVIGLAFAGIDPKSAVPGSE